MINQRKIPENLNCKKIAILGLGMENQALLKYLLKNKIDAQITVCDARQPLGLGDKFTEFAGRKNINWQLGRTFNKKLYVFDVLFRAPGWPINCPGIQEALKKNKNIELSSPMKLFLDICPAKNIIGVTGTKGKGTTSSLIAAILKAGGKRVWLGGNIGVAPFDFFSKIKKTDWVVLELSSFQLEDMHKSPHVAVITNLYEEHLAPADPLNPNYHQSFNAYCEAKMNIVRWQLKGDYAILNSKLKPAPGGGKKIKFGKSKLPSKLIGKHNQENIAAAIEVAKIAKVKDGEIKKAVANFRGLEHRLEFFHEANGVRFYNDSFATTPESSVIALKSFSAPIILLAGGADKGADFKGMAKEVVKRAKFVVLFKGDATSRMKNNLLVAGFPKNKMKEVGNIRDAVAAAIKHSERGDVVLLSTGCASFGVFKNYKERGWLFKEEIKKQSHN